MDEDAGSEGFYEPEDIVITEKVDRTNKDYEYLDVSDWFAAEKEEQKDPAEGEHVIVKRERIGGVEHDEDFDYEEELAPMDFAPFDYNELDWSMMSSAELEALGASMHRDQDGEAVVFETYDNELFDAAIESHAFDEVPVENEIAYDEELDAETTYVDIDGTPESETFYEKVIPGAYEEVPYEEVPEDHLPATFEDIDTVVEETEAEPEKWTDFEEREDVPSDFYDNKVRNDYGFNEDVPVEFESYDLDMFESAVEKFEKEELPKSEV